MVEISKIYFSQLQWQIMTKHVARCFPEEACGLVGGKGNRASVVIPITNVLHSSKKYLMNAEEQLKTFICFEKNNLDLLAIYHSHPSGPDTPSETDIAEFAYPGVIIMIWTLIKTWQARGYVIQENRESKPILLLLE